MKRIRTLALITVMMVFAMTSQALAYFEQGSLVMALYAESQEDVTEVVVDLGTTASIDWSATNLQLASADLSAFNSDLSDLRVGYFSMLSSTYNFCFATTESESAGVRSSSVMSFIASGSAVYNNYAGTAQSVVGTTTNSNSYDVSMNENGNNPGAYASLNPNPSTGESTLADLATVGYVDMYFYRFTGISLVEGTDPVSGEATDYTGIIRLYADGSVVLNPTAVPIPASVMLFGSGLLGFVGLRRKNS